MAQKTQNLKGQKFAVPTNPGIYIGKDWRGKVVDLLNCFYNPKIQIKTINSADNQTILTDSDVQMGPLGWVATIDLTNAGVGNGATSGGGYMGNYSNASSYTTGQTVRVLTATTISGVSVAAGYYGVPPGITVPASGTGNQIPQYPEPTSGTVYWHLIVQYC